MRARRVRGFTLIELMIALAIVAIISAIALPAYNNYLDTSREAVLVQNIDGMRLFQEDVRLRTGAYAAGTWNPAGGVTTLADNLGWRPDGDDETITYVVTVIGGTSWTVVATNTEDGTTVTRTYPQ